MMRRLRAEHGQDWTGRRLGGKNPGGPVIPQDPKLRVRLAARKYKVCFRLHTGDAVMATCTRCGTIMAAAPGTKCPACGMVRDPPVTKPVAEKTAPAAESASRHAPERPGATTSTRA